MLTPDERREIEEELARYPTRQAVSIDAMKIVQRHRGWVSDESLADIADLLGLPRHELDAVATFYNLIFRKPVGRHVIFVCDSVSCWIMGYERLYKALSARLGITFGQTTADGRFTLLPIVCLGACDRAPAMLIDGTLHPAVDPDGIDPILDRYE
jgi:NADH-quinone oxidoreductase subunit E